MRRECLPGVQVTTWRDVCEGGLQYYGSCSASTLCVDILDELDETIRCVPLKREGETEPRLAKTDPQIGTSGIQSALINLVTGRTQLTYQVVIEDDMKASVTAMFLSMFLPLASKLVLII